ncbi:unnamed protein product, partial [Dracunculus medinensis]|uniref:Activin_recp domain-containing protein n=1 Tax=Dracunculus medinensis TaxID=318479 RepID=A0A0N4USB3_DRAME
VFLQYVSAASECKHGECAYGEEIADFGCRRTNQKCGENMVFRLISKAVRLQNSFPIYQCWQRCICAKKYFAVSNGKCIKKEFPKYQNTAKVNSQNTSDERNFKIHEKIVDYGCEKTSKKCGTNMIYKTISKTIFLDSSAYSYRCFQICSCIDEKYIERNGQCVEKPSNSSERFSSNDKICWLRCQCENESYTREGEKCVEIQQRTVIANNPTTIGEIP